MVAKLNARLVLEPGFDPHAEKLVVRASGTFAQDVKDYLVWARGKNPKSVPQKERAIRVHYLGTWGKQKSGAIKRPEVQRIFDKISKSSESSANQALAHVSGFFTWAIKNDRVAPPNPCHGIERNENGKRSRVLDDTEIKKFWAALNNLTNPVIGRCLKVLLLTGQRPGEVTRMRREHLKPMTIEPALDETVKRRLGKDAPAKVDGLLWEMPGAFSADYDPETKNGQWPGTKNGADHKIWLSGAVVKLIGDGPRPGAVFPVTTRVLENTMRSIVKYLGIPRATPHDLRRTNGTTIIRDGFNRDAMNRWQGHADGGIADTYDWFKHYPESWLRPFPSVSRIC